MSDQVGAGEGWMRVAFALEQEIADGSLQPGAKLPIEPQLAERFGVGRHTVRRAVAELAERGIIRIRQGSGMYVNDHAVGYILDKKTRFTETVSRQNRSPSGTLIADGRLGADDRMALHLNVAPGTPCIMLETLQRIDDRPASVVSHVFPAGRFEGIAEAYKETGSISLALERFDAADYARRTTVITAAMPDSRDARLLDLPKNTPVIITEAVNVDRNGTPIEYGLARASPLEMQFIVES